jgi:hypothetical protein
VRVKGVAAVVEFQHVTLHIKAGLSGRRQLVRTRSRSEELIAYKKVYMRANEREDSKR